MSINAVIDFNKFEGPVYAGRERAERLREVLAMDRIDASNESVSVVIPDQTYSVTSSFFLGLFAPSIIKAGSKVAFLNKFRFNAPDYVMEDFDAYITRALVDNSSFQ